MLAVSLFAAVGLGFVGVASADAPTATDCSGFSWTTQQLSGEAYYEVDSLEKLQCIQTKGLSNNYVLTSDIDASETATWNGGKGFDPIGDPNGKFTGTFHGDGHTISGLSIDRGGTSDIGLFGTVSPGGTVRSVRLDGGTVTGGEYVGALVGTNNGTVSQSVATVEITAYGGRVGGLVGDSGGTVEDSHATGAVFSTDNGRIGGLVGENDGTVEASYATGDVTSESANGGRVGGLVGLDRGTIRYAYATGDVTTDIVYGGGLVGETYGTIEDSYATGDVTADTYDAAGLAGSSTSVTIRRTYATGAVSITNGGTGGLVGDVDNGGFGSTIANSYWDAGTTDQGSAFGTTYGDVTTSGLTSFGTTADTAPAPEMQGSSAKGNMPGLDFTNTWETVESEDPDAAMDGYPILRALDRKAQLRAQGIYEIAPTESDCNALSWSTRTISGETYYEVDSLVKLQCIQTKGLGDNYVQTQDIDASETGEWNDRSGFDPIGDKDNEFTGTFDGNGYTISGLIIDRGGTYSVGLFSEIGPGGTVKTVGLEGGSVTGTRRVGQLTGYNDGTVEDSHATGEITGRDRVGGLVGRNDGTVRRSYASGEPTRGSDWFGGLVGFNQGMIDRSFAARAVVGGGGSTSAGGLVGVSTGTIADSYATGSVTSSWYAGGVLGSFQADPGGVVRRSYATGALSVDDETQGIGGLVGGSAVSPTTVEQAYWDVGTTNEESVSTGDGWDPITFTAVSGFGATADTAPAPEIQGSNAKGNMPGLDFTNTWETVASENPDAAMDGYPILRALDRTVQLRAQGNTPDTTPSVADCADLSWATRDISGTTYYEIDSLYKLQCIENRGLGNDYVLTGDIDASETGEWNGGDGFDPIGDPTTRFTGTFDGDGYTISGLTIDRENTRFIGLFGVVGPSGAITNVDLTGATVTGWESVGPLVGANVDGTITNATAAGTTTATGSTAGGLVGFHGGTISRSAATGTSTASSEAGGLVGFNEGVIEGSYATGAAISTDSSGGDAGGLVGENGGASSSGTVQRSYATGSVSTNGGNAGGLVGHNTDQGTVELSYWDVGTTGVDQATGSDTGTLSAVAGLGSTGAGGPAVAATGDTVYDTMPGLDFASTWTVTSEYPRLKWERVDGLTVDSLGATSPTVGEGEAGTITVTATDDQGSPADGVTVEVATAAGLSGLGGEAVTDANGQVTFSFTEDTAGDYAPGFAWKYDDEVGETVTTQSLVSVRDGPEVDAITRTGASPTNAATVEFDVTFSERVTGVDTGDFDTTQVSGDVTGSVATVGGSGSSYTVTVDSVTGEGAFRLDLVDDDSITAADSGIALGGVGTSGGGDGSADGERYRIDTTEPTFSAGATNTVPVNEGTTGVVLDIDANDSAGSDDAAVDYSLGGVDAGPFSLDTDTGELSLDDPQEFERPSDDDGDGDYDLTVTATDDAGNTGTQRLTVSLADVDEAPTFSSSASARIAGDATTGDGVFDADATVGAAADDGVSYAITGGNVDVSGDGVAPFEIDRSTGQIVLADADDIDRSVRTRFSLAVTASEGTASATQTVTVTVTDAATPTVSTFSVANPADRDIVASVESDERLATVAVAIGGAETATLPTGAFAETDDGDGTYTYTATYTGGTDGIYTATLDAAVDAAGNDGAGGESDSVTVDTEGPVANASFDRTVDVGQRLILDGRASTDAVGISRYEWDVDGDGVFEETGRTATHAWPTPGIEVVVLRVTDLEGRTATETLTVSVEAVKTPTPSPPPTPVGPVFSVVGLDAPATVTAGEPRNLSVTVRNQGDTAGTYAGSVGVNGTAVATTSIEVDAGETATAVVSVAFGGAGPRTVSVGNASRELTVEPAASPSAAAVYRSDDGRVSVSEAAEAVERYDSGVELPGYGPLSAADVMSVIAAANEDSE